MNTADKHNHTQPTVLCIGAGREQVQIIELARSRHIHVLALDGNPAAPGLAIADEAAVLDLRDADAVIQWARVRAPSAVLPAPLGAMLTTVGAVNDALGLPGISKMAAGFCVDKLLFHEKMVAAGVPVPRQRPVTTLAEAKEAAHELNWPVVVKPRTGSGSRGVFVARTPAELESLFVPGVEQVLVQECISGHEVGIDGAVVNGQAHVFLIRDKMLTALPYRAGIGYLAPTTLDHPARAAVASLVAHTARVAGLDNCLLHADVMVSPQGNPVLIEMSGRPSGYDLSLRMTPAVTGLAPIPAMLDHLLGREADWSFKREPQGGCLRMLEVPPGKVRSIRGFDQALGMPGVVTGACFIKPGDTIVPSIDGPSSFIGYLLTSAETRAQAEACWQAAANVIRVESVSN